MINIYSNTIFIFCALRLKDKVRCPLKMQKNEKKIQTLKKTLDKLDHYMSKARKIFNEIEPTLDNYAYLLKVSTSLNFEPEEIEFEWDLEYNRNDGSTNGDIYFYTFSEDKKYSDW